MIVSKLIELLSTCDPDAEVLLHSHRDYNGEEPLFVLSRCADPMCVWIESKNDCDFPYQLGCRFDDAFEKPDELDLFEFYKDLIDRGVTCGEVRKYVSEEHAEKMDTFCREHKLI